MAITLHNPDDTPPTSGAAGPQQRFQPPANGAAGPPQQRGTVDVVDSKGRRIVWRRLSALEDFDLSEIAGTNTSNPDWMARATLAFGTREIDGEPIGRPTNKNHIRALIGRLEEEGLTAIIEGIGGLSSEAGSETDRAKNSQGIPKSGEGSP